MSGILRGVRPLDYVLAALMTAAGAFIMVMNIVGDGAAEPHPISTTSWLIVPLFLLVTVPVLGRRRNVVAVVGITAAAAAVHVLAFSWLSRCGVVLPLSFALAYAVARFSGSRRDHLLGLAGVVVLQLVTLVRDSSIDRVVEALPVALPGAALFYGIGLLVQNRVSRKQSAPAEPAAQHATV